MSPPRTYDVFIAVRSARLCVTHLQAIGLEATARIVGVDVYYRTDTDTVLIALRLDPRTATATLMARLHAEAEAAGAAVLEPARLDDADRERFYGEHLATYPLQVRDFPTVADAVRKVAGDLGFQLESTPPIGTPQVEVRFRCGDEWRLGRPRSLTREGIYLYSGHVPRMGETVTLRMIYGTTRLDIRAEVMHTTTEEAAAQTVGGAGFAARFILGEQSERLALESLVVAGRRDGLAALRPAPPRRDARYPVRWPVAIDVADGPLAALDVSRRGIFVATAALPAGETVEVAVSPDDGGSAIRARGRVARTVDDRSAKIRGVAPGCGLELFDFAPGDADRFGVFVDRVAERAARRVLIGASEPRQGSLVGPLTAAGYVVSAAASTQEILAQAQGMDLVFLDPSLASAANELRRALSKRKIAAFSLEPGQNGRAVRNLADAALLG